MQPIHDRQPVILAPADFNEWPSRSERPPVQLLRILAEEETAMSLLNTEEPKADESVMKGLFD
jgi:putative SOS response-associated peptidase YedK